MATDIMEQLRATFSEEALDLLIELDSALLALEGCPADSALINRVFRAIHTIKGIRGDCRSSAAIWPKFLLTMKWKRPLIWPVREVWTSPRK